MNRRVLRFGAIIGAATVSMLAIAPVFAAAPVSQATANALSLSIGGTDPISSGTATATNNGTTETKGGATQPVLGVLNNQGLLNVGVAAQAAEAQVASNGDGISAGCAGVAGEGASVVEIGDSTCLTPGTPVGLTLANLDLTGAQVIDPASSLGALSALNGVLGDILGPLTSAVSDALAPLGNTGLTGSLGAVAARCTARPGSAEGSANIVDGSITLNVAGTPYTLLNLPVNPTKNQELVADLGDVLNAVIDGLEIQLNTLLNGSLSAILDPVVALFPTIKAQIVTAILGQVGTALAPLTDGIVKVVFNEQADPDTTPGDVKVTALHLTLLSAISQFTGAPLVDLKIGTVTCGPNDKVVSTTPTPTPTEEPPGVPTVVDSGVTGASHTTRDVLMATTALMLLAGSAGLIGYRRMLSK